MNPAHTPTPDNRFLLLPFTFNPEQLKKDLSICDAAQWIAHYNTKDYQGEWTGIALRSATGSASDIRVESPDDFMDTPLLGQCAYFREIISLFLCPVETVRLLALSPGSMIKEHRDPGLGYAHGRFRLHIPITTDPHVAFMVDGHELRMDEGQCWYADFSLPHSVRHDGYNRRIHLVIDGLRNAWTDDLFSRAGYSFETEQKDKQYDAATIREMILHLRQMNTDTARALIADLESSLPHQDNQATPEETLTLKQFQKGWLPISVEKSKDGCVLKWQYIGAPPFTEPFFHETIQKSRHHATNKAFPNVITPLSALRSNIETLGKISPTAIIFHTSRCGSTLLTQLLSCDEDNLILSEVPILDAFLRLPFQASDITASYGDQLFAAFISCVAQQAGSSRKSLFVKTDSWHVFSYERLRRLYPETPMLLIYRHPEDILLSHRQQPGMQTIPNSLEAEYTGIPEHLNGVPGSLSYLEHLLTEIFKAFCRIAENDTNSHLIAYHDGWEKMIRITEKATHLRFTQPILDRMTHRSRFHSKKPYEPLTEESRSVSSAISPPELVDLFLQLEVLKDKQQSHGTN